MGGVCGTQRVEDKCVHDFGEGKLGDLPVWILLLLLLLLLLILFFILTLRSLCGFWSSAPDYSRFFHL